MNNTIILNVKCYGHFCSNPSLSFSNYVMEFEILNRHTQYFTHSFAITFEQIETVNIITM